MGLFRRDKDHKDAKDKTKELRQAAEEKEALEEELSDEEYTDISEAADDSFSQPQNSKMEFIVKWSDEGIFTINTDGILGEVICTD